MKKVSYTCDACRHTIKESRKTYHVTIRSSHESPPEHTSHLCKKCAEFYAKSIESGSINVFKEAYSIAPDPNRFTAWALSILPWLEDNAPKSHYFDYVTQLRRLLGEDC